MRAVLVIFIASQLVASRLTVAQDSLKDQAVAEFVEYMSRSESDLGDFYMLADVAIQTTPDSTHLYEFAMRFERLVFEEDQIQYEDLHRQSIYPPEGKRGEFNLPCRRVQFWKKDVLYKKLSLGNWIKYERDELKADPRKAWSYCYFQNIFDWPFLHQSVISANREQPRVQLENKCQKAAKDKDAVLVAEWYRSDGKGYAKLYTGFKDGVPVRFEIIGFLGPTGDKNTDLTKGRVLSRVETTWKDFNDVKLPTKISAVVASASSGERDITYLVDVKVDWKFGEDIPKNLIEEINKIAESTK